MGDVLSESAVFDLLLVPTEEVTDFVEEGDADFLGEGMGFVLGVAVDVLEPEADAGHGVFLEVAEGIGFDAFGEVLLGRVFFEEHRHVEESLSNGFGQLGNGCGDFRLRNFEEFPPVHEGQRSEKI